MLSTKSPFTTCLSLIFIFPIIATAQPDFAKVEKPRAWSFPRDHGKHAEYQVEWWYFTGNLQAANGRRFGYELTFFRQAFAPTILSRTSQWAFREAYMAHFAITDINNKTFRYEQKSARGTLNLAGADSASLSVHLGGWYARQKNFEMVGKNQIQLRAASDFGQIELNLAPAKPPVFHGDRGLLPNSKIPGDAAYYYSLTSLKTTGYLTVAGKSLEVRGLSWMDHEFFTPHLASAGIGWNWLSLHLSDSTEVMLAFLRRAGGFEAMDLSGTFIDQQGFTRHLTKSDFVLTPTSWWISPKSGGKYPMAWNVKYLEYDLRLTTPVEDQEFDARRSTGNIYWEGYVEAVGKKGDRAIRGKGYLEMTGYTQ